MYSVCNSVEFKFEWLCFLNILSHQLKDLRQMRGGRVGGEGLMVLLGLEDSVTENNIEMNTHASSGYWLTISCSGTATCSYFATIGLTVWLFTFFASQPFQIVCSFVPGRAFIVSSISIEWGLAYQKWSGAGIRIFWWNWNQTIPTKSCEWKHNVLNLALPASILLANYILLLLTVASPLQGLSDVWCQANQHQNCLKFGTSGQLYIWKNLMYMAYTQIYKHNISHGETLHVMSCDISLKSLCSLELHTDMGFCRPRWGTCSRTWSPPLVLCLAWSRWLSFSVCRNWSPLHSSWARGR